MKRDIFKTMNTEYLQVWPSGKSYQFQGDIHGPAERRRLRNSSLEPWRPGTPEEWRKIEVETLAKIYADRDVLCCDSSLVDDLIKSANSGDRYVPDLAEGFSDEEIRGLYRDPSDWTLEQCRDYLSDYGGDEPDDPNPWTMDRSAIVEALEAVSIECRDDESVETLREALIANIDDETIDGLDTWRDAAREHAQDNPAEVYEWWRVSSWLCRQLDSIGEVTIDNGYGCWWGRTCTGQGFLMDGTLQRVAEQFARVAES